MTGGEHPALWRTPHFHPSYLDCLSCASYSVMELRSSARVEEVVHYFRAVEHSYVSYVSSAVAGAAWRAMWRRSERGGARKACSGASSTKAVRASVVCILLSQSQDGFASLCSNFVSICAVISWPGISVRRKRSFFTP